MTSPSLNDTNVVQSDKFGLDILCWYGPRILALWWTHRTLADSTFGD